ncbi:hypothetical protein RUM44_004902 [Polyplax serrata]|uniref:Folate gamma-glutamyl hydrolase n=1 Tax=Polyplax serrata TaxID=468196 RepID=A0ABR1B4V6_POLSC
MKSFLLFFTFLVYSSAECPTVEKDYLPCNQRPIVGILSQEVTGLLKDYYGDHYAYISAAYVKHVESAGGRVVPIW